MLMTASLAVSRQMLHSKRLLSSGLAEEGPGPGAESSLPSIGFASSPPSAIPTRPPTSIPQTFVKLEIERE